MHDDFVSQLVGGVIDEDLTEDELKILHRLIHRVEMLKCQGEIETNED